MRSSSQCVGSAARIGQEWNPRQPRFTAHTRWARSSITSAFDVVPFGVLTIVVLNHSGAVSGIRFWKNELPVEPLGKRCSSTGRLRITRITGASMTR
ncbi:unannotated protein [freshwater metagenome]|uniref:Unannotated protein n=1 Tax=freshwater metagenome TaxID=449393 RepID=A0A6J6C642_9ZZZZ